MMLRTNQPYNSRISRRGFSLLEMAIVLGIAGLIAGGIWVAASTAYFNYRVGKTMEQVQQIVDNIRDHYSAASVLPSMNYNVFTQNEARADVFPADTKTLPGVLPTTCQLGPDPCYFVNPWSSNGTGAVCGGGTICVGSNNGSLFGPAVLGYNFVVKLRNLPGAACVEVARKMAGIWDEIGLTALGISTTNAVAAGTIFNVPPAVAAIIAACDAANPNHLFLEFRLQTP